MLLLKVVGYNDWALPSRGAFLTLVHLRQWGVLPTPLADPGPGTSAPPRDLRRYAYLSIAAALVTIALKTAAWLLTGSVGLLSDAAESLVNLVAAVAVLVALRVAAMPADKNHHFGHTKAEYFSAAIEGQMIFVAAVVIMWTSVDRFLNPQPLENVGIGLVISVVAALINGGVGLLLIRAGRRHRSLTLTADGKHLMTDVWTTIGVVVGVAVVALTGWLRLDPLIAIAVAINILITGGRLIYRSGRGLLDAALPQHEVALVHSTLAQFVTDDVHFHAVTTRESGRDRFVSMHVLVPGAWSVQQAHDLVEEVEAAIEQALPQAIVDTHVEPAEDPRSYEDYQSGAHIGPAGATAGHGTTTTAERSPAEPDA